MSGKIFGYENRMVVLLCLTVGIVFFDRNAINFLMPFIAPELGLNNTRIGLLASGLSLAWAVSGLGLSALIDAKGNRRAALIAMVVIFSLCSIVSGIAATFVGLLMARVVMGLSEGPILPVAQSIAALESSEHRRGLNMGIIQNLGGGLLGQFAAPLVVVGIANLYGWREAFYVAGVPGLVLAVLAFFFLREPVAHEISHADADEPAIPKEKTRILDLLRVRNVWLCCAISCLMVSWLILSWVFTPLYLVKELGVSSGNMSMLMGAAGVSSAICGAFIASSLSDRIGRKPVMIVFCLIGMLAPIAVVMHGGSLVLTAALIFIGTAASGTFPIFMATIPSESLPARYLGTSIALVVAVGEILGGVTAPLVAGRAADLYGLISPMFMQMGLVLLAGVLSCFLVETAPNVVRGRALVQEAVA